MRNCVLSFLFFLLFVPLLGQMSPGGASPLLESAHYGILLKPLGDSGSSVAYQSDKSFTPASVMKLLTTATALETLGGDFRYVTKLQYSGEIVDGVLHGDVVIVGSGDPTLGSIHFYEHPDAFLDVWASEIQSLGIDSITGTVVADASVFDKQVIPDKWIWEDIGNYYGAGCYGLSVFDNMYSLYFGATEVGDLTSIDSVRPQVALLSFDNHVVAADNNRDNAYIYGSPWGFEKQIFGSIPAGRGAFRIKGALPNPPLLLAAMLQERIQRKGIVVAKPARVLWEKNVTSNTTISRWFSPSLVDIIKVTNKESNNLFAEHLLKTIAVNPSASASLSSAIDMMMAFWADKGLQTAGVKVYDGSGLSRASLLTPGFVVGMLEYMLSTSTNAEGYLTSLATSGVDGTFKYFLDGTELQGKVHGKSGSMSGVRCYAGVIDRSPGERYVFCIMVNNFTASSAAVRNAIENHLLDLLR